MHGTQDFKPNAKEIIFATNRARLHITGSLIMAQDFAGAACGAKNGGSKCGSTFPVLLPLIVYALVKDYMDRVGRVQFVEEVEVLVEKKRVSPLHP